MWTTLDGEQVRDKSQDLFDVTADKHSGVYAIQAFRYLDTNDNYDKALSIEQNYELYWKVEKLSIFGAEESSSSLESETGTYLLLLKDPLPIDLPLQQEWRYFDLHCWLLWIAWNFLSLGLVGSVRWWHHHYKYSQLAHSVIGVLLMALTIWLGTRACLYLTTSRIELNVHAVVGIFILFMILLPAVTGSIALYFRLTKQWKQDLIQEMKVLHRQIGYTFVALGLVECTSGIIEFFKEVDPSMIYPLVVGNIAFTVTSFSFFEYRHRSRQTK